MTLFLDIFGSQHLDLSYPPNKTPFVCSATVLKLYGLILKISIPSYYYMIFSKFQYTRPVGQTQ